MCCWTRRGTLLGDTIAYRDSRTQGMDAKLEKTLSFEELYARVGIAKQPFNTLYQLMATPKEQLDAAVDFLMVPDYLHYLLTGVKANEYTNASTTSMLDPVARDWDREVLTKAGIPERIFRKPVDARHPAGCAAPGGRGKAGLHLRCGASRYP